LIFEVTTLHKILKKASLIACLFILSNNVLAQERSLFKLDDPLIRAYENILKLELKESRTLLKSYEGPARYGKVYIDHLNDVLEVFLGEDSGLFERFNEKTDNRIKKLKEAPENPYKDYYISEIKLHRAFVYMKFGEEFSAAWTFRQSFFMAERITKNYPEFEFSLKTLGLMHIIIGATPEKYQWLLNLFGFHGSLQQGIDEVKQFSTIGPPFSVEGDVMLAIVHAYLLQDSDTGISFLTKYNEELNNQLLLSYAMASILIKSSRSEEALNILNRFTGDPSPLSFIHYLRGNILQQKGEYQESTDSFNNFLTEFKGHNFVKDVNFKIGLNYWLLFDSVLAEKYFELARNTGETLIEADKNAASMLKEPMPDINIMKLRLHTDGGYFQEAYNLVTEIEESKLDSHKDSVEFIYRKARLFHKSGNKEEAIINYEKTIEENENERWYFAPNSALQLGYIYREKGMLAEARKLFEKAVSYKNHPYKHSIDNEAKAALASLNTKN